MKQIKAIQTSYAGYKFRSRLEARWAVFFDAMGYRWEYEPEGFILPNGAYYLPDFRLSLKYGATQWVEVKPISGVDCTKFNEFKDAIDGKWDAADNDSFEFAKMVVGDPRFFLNEAYLDGVSTHTNSGFVCHVCGMIIGSGDWDTQCGGIEIRWYCRNCDANSTNEWHSLFNDQNGPLLVEHHKGDNIGLTTDYRFNDNIAAIKARSARFEHGETPGQ